MKTRTWIWILGALFLVSLGLSLLPGSPAGWAEIWSDGVLVKTVSLRQEQSFVVHSQAGENTVTVRDGKIAVTQSDCPGGDCVAQGWQEGGRAIVCLPNRLIIRFVAEGLDAVAG